MQFSTLFVTMAIAAVSSALPVAQNTTVVRAALEPRQAAGHATFYNTYYPTFSSCGEQPQDTDLVAALAPSFMPSACGKTIAVTNQVTGSTVNVRVVDTCMACAGGAVAVDLSPAAFQATGAHPDEGKFAVSWSFV